MAWWHARFPVGFVRVLQRVSKASLKEILRIRRVAGFYKAKGWEGVRGAWLQVSNGIEIWNMHIDFIADACFVLQLINCNCIYLKFSWRTLAIRWILIMLIVYPIGPVSIS